MREVYFLRRADGTGPIKIGCSDWPESRRKQLGIDVKVEFAILASAPGDFMVERNLHLKFRDTRAKPTFAQIRGYTVGAPTEWFEATHELLSYIEEVRRCGEIKLAASERREMVITRRYVRGETLQQIGDSLGITRERVRQILNAHGVPSRGYGYRSPKCRKAAA